MTDVTGSPGILRNWKFFILIGLPLALLPLLFIETGKESSKWGCAYVTLLMGFYWMTEVVPLPVTAFLPIVLFPLLGVQDTASVSRNYMKEQNMMVVGGLIVALSVQYSNLHTRVALAIVTTLGSSPRRLMFGIMLTTACLSMWISNSTAAAIMVPVVLAIIDLLQIGAGDENSGKVNPGYVGDESSLEKGVEERDDDEPRQSGIDEGTKKGLFIGVMAAANIGGLMWPYTAHSSIPLYRLISNEMTHPTLNYTEEYLRRTLSTNNLNVVNWMFYNLPPLLVNVLIAWLYLVWMFVGVRSIRSSSYDKNYKRTLKDKSEELGAISFQEIAVSILITLLAGLYLFRDPKVVKGWGDVLGTKVEIGDSTAAMLLVFLLFLIPKDFDFLLKGQGKVESLLDWKFVQNNLPWGVVLLLGGGYAISDACRVSGLSIWIGQQLTGLKDLPYPLILFILLIITSVLAEFASNTGSANALIPIIFSLSNRLGVTGLYLTLPVTVMSSMAFILPVATPSNAIVFASGNVRVLDMIKSGPFLNLSTLVVLFLFNITYATIIFS